MNYAGVIQIEPREAGPEPSQNFIADRAGRKARILDRHFFATSFANSPGIAAPSGRSVTSTVMRSIETRPTMRREMAR